MSPAAAASFAAIVEAARSLAWSGQLPAGAHRAEERQA
jgi:hypothetical protein